MVTVVILAQLCIAFFLPNAIGLGKLRNAVVEIVVQLFLGDAANIGIASVES